MKVTIIGNGAWGRALAKLADRHGHHVAIWGRHSQAGECIDLKEAINGAEMVILAIPSHSMREVCQKMKPHVSEKMLFISVAKGIEYETGFRMSQVLSEVLDTQKVAAMSGPTFASEVALALPSALVAAATNKEWASEIQKAFTGEDFRVYTSTDLIGVEFGGALKNVMAIAAGACVGLGLGDNSLAALITRGVAELSRIGVALGGKAQTFFGLSGMGDLILTCSSSQSRNRRVGEGLGRGEKLEHILSHLHGTAEGVKTALSIQQILQNKKLESPILQEVFEILYKDKQAKEAVRALMGREPKGEFSEN